MPSGGSEPLSGKDWDYVKSCYDDAVKHGLQYEWLQYFAGGLINNKLSAKAAAYAACIEWDF